MSTPADAIAKFVDITGQNTDRAKFYLEAASYDLDIALQHFFEENSGEGAESDDEALVAPPVSANSKRPSQPSKTNARFQTVSNLAKDSSSDEDEGAQAFFAGGSQHSGQQVLGPSTRNQFVANVFKSLREHGGVTSQEPGGSQKSHNFGGTGYRLGQTTDDTQVIGGAAKDGENINEVTFTVKMWRQGFSINDGPFRPLQDPANMDFLKTLSTGVLPDELSKEARGREAHLCMEDHSHEEYVRSTKVKVQAFTGKGNVLGSPVPGSVAPPPPSQSSDPTGDTARARAAVPLNSAQPLTTVQIRLADGSRLVVQMNNTHTIADVRTYITTARPEYAEQPFRLLTTFPSKELADPSATLEAAGVLNSAILQRLGP